MKKIASYMLLLLILFTISLSSVSAAVKKAWEIVESDAFTNVSLVSDEGFVAVSNESIIRYDKNGTKLWSKMLILLFQK